MDFRDDADDGADVEKSAAVVPPEQATPEQVERYNQEYLKHHPRAGVDDTTADDATVTLPYAKQQDRDAKYKSEFPWLYDPAKGRRWDFDPVELRVLSQENAWVQMMVQTITKEIAETSWTITEEADARETDKRLSTEPGQRDPIEKDLTTARAEELYEDLRHPTPDLNWTEAVEMWMRDYLEVGAMTGIKAFDQRFYDEDDELVADPDQLTPLGLRPSAPEVWTKDYTKSGMLDGFWQFSRITNPGSTSGRGRGTSSPIHFKAGEVMWADNSLATNRGYGTPPTLFIKDFVESVGLAVTQEQQYLSRGSIPSGAWVFEEWDREQVKEWKEQNAENLKGKPHKSLMFAGQGGDVNFEAMSLNFQEMQFTERMQWYARVIASAFQVPTAVVGVEPETVNYNTFQGERENFESNTLGPYLQDFERWINFGWLSHFDGHRFEFTPGFSETTKQMRSSRIVQEFNANLRPRASAARELGIDLPETADDGFKTDVVDDVAPEDAGGALDDMLAGELSKDDPDDASRAPLRNTDEYAEFAVQPSDVDALYEEIADDVRALFDDVLSDDDILDAIEQFAADPDDDATAKSLNAISRKIRDFLSGREIANKIRETVQEQSALEIRETLRHAKVQSDADVDIDPIVESLQERDVAFADDFANDISEAIRDTVADGWEAGKNSLEIREDLQDKSEEFSDWGAERIARQELQVASGEARNQFAAEADKIEVWNTSGDDRVRDAHAAMDGMWKFPDEDWVVEYDRRGTQKEHVPGDSEPGIGCRCGTLLVDREDVDADDHAGDTYDPSG